MSHYNESFNESLIMITIIRYKRGRRYCSDYRLYMGLSIAAVWFHI